jgi:hypothetical protein
MGKENGMVIELLIPHQNSGGALRVYFHDYTRPTNN